MRVKRGKKRRWDQKKERRRGGEGSKGNRKSRVRGEGDR